MRVDDKISTSATTTVPPAAHRSEVLSEETFPLTLAILADWLEELDALPDGYTPVPGGAVVDWLVFSRSDLHNNEAKIAILLARAVCLAERAGGVPRPVRRAVRVAVERLTDSKWAVR